VFTHTIPLLFAGGVCCAAGALAGLEEAGGVDAAGVAAAVSAVSAFFDLDDFLLLEASALEAPVLVSVEVAVFLDLEGFDVELSAAVEESEASAFLLFDDFLVPEAEVSVAEVSSLVVLFFFFFDFVVLVLVSLWSFDCVDGDDCDA
jgi:hypothetical protein